MSRFMRSLSFITAALGALYIVRLWIRQRDAMEALKYPSLTPNTPPEEVHIVLPRQTLDAAEAQAREAQTRDGDRLTYITGIGPKTAEALQAAGITTYADLAAANPESLLQTLHDVVRGISTEKINAWIAQAHQLTQNGNE